jgi:hypothetical protein
MTRRRYGEDEAREIFSLATTGDAREQALPTETGGMTLEELQRIGQEAGIEPARISEAAARLGARGKTAPTRRSFGLPVGMTRVVELPRAPTDREWEQLISQFRTTFGTQGGISTTSGGLREWTQGDLHITVEPTEHGEQLRLTTLKNDAIALNGLALVLGTMAALMGATVAAAGKPEKALAVVGMFGGMALISIVANLVRLPAWARERERQLEAAAQHAVRLLSRP